MRKSLLLTIMLLASASAYKAFGQMTLRHYSAPTYEDYYINTSGWNNKDQWNLNNVHDPSVVKAADGYYYMYQTDASYGNSHEQSGGHFICRRSKNLIDWQVMGPVMKGIPSWVKSKLNSIRSNMGLGNTTIDFSNQWNFGYWAPCVRKVNNNLYRMYYVITMPGKINGNNSWTERAFIGLMETNNPANINSWVDKGYVLTNYSDRNLNFYTTAWSECYFKYNAIDPSYIINEKGEHWLVYGSWHSGFAAVQINPSTGMTIKSQGNPWGSANEAAYGKKVFSRYLNDRWQASEAPEVVYHNGYYYMFIAFDELSVAYNTRVVRSRNIDGPYYDITGQDFTNGTRAGNVYPIVTHPYKFENDHGWQGISHCAIFDDGNGNWFYSSQQRFPANYNGNAYSNAIMLGAVRRLIWTESGWPVVMPERYGAVPQDKITENEVKGTWQVINLGYKTSGDRMDASTHVTFRSDHIAYGGPLNGQSWSYDANKGILTVGTNKLYLTREVDWEASPRKATIVFAGLSADGKTTFWGKKPNTATNGLTQVGAADCSASWWTAFSPYYKIPSEATQQVGFINHSSRQNNYNNWVLCVTNDADRGASNYQEYFSIRADWYGWGNDDYNSSELKADYATNDALSQLEWRQQMDGAYVTMTVKRSGAEVYVTAKMTARDGRTMTETYHQRCGDGKQNIRMFLVCDGSYYEIDPQDVKQTTAQPAQPTQPTQPTSTANGTIYWAFNQGTANQKAIVGNDLTGKVSTSVTIGSGLTYSGIRTLNDLSETCIGVTVGNNPAPDANNYLTFNVAPAEGYELSITKIEFTATRVGTDGGYIDVSWGGDKIAEKLRPARNNGNPQYTTYTYNVNPGDPKEAHQLTFNVYALGITKQIAFGNIKLYGTVKKITGNQLPITENGTIFWAFNQGTANQQAVVGNDLEGKVSTDVTIGSGLTYNGIRTLNDLSETCIGVTVGNNPVADDNNKLSFSVTPINGYELAINKIEFIATRIGTDGGYIDVSWAGNKVAEKLRPTRNNATPQYTVYTYSVNPGDTKKGHKLTFNVYALGSTKQIGFANIKLYGTLTSPSGAKTAFMDEVTDINNLESESLAEKDDAWYTLQGVRIDKPTTKGIYIHRGKKVFVK